MTDNPYENASILIADDDPNARFMLREFLEEEGYRVTEAADGVQALALYEEAYPSLVLLDAMMPTSDGFEVCTQIQLYPSRKRAPVLMITGLNDQSSVDRAFEVGATDYVTKPINWAVLRQRVRRLLHTVQLERMRDNLTHMIVHDMKNPISTIKGYMEVTLDDIQEQPDYEWLEDRLTRVHRASNNLLNMAMMILDTAKMNEGKLALQRSSRSVLEVLQEVRQSFDLMAEDREIEIQINCPDETLTASLDWQLIQRVVGNLLGNAIKHSPLEDVIVLSGCLSAEPTPTLLLSVKDHGEGLAPEDQDRVFEAFTQATHRVRGSNLDTGLGLTFCKMATEAHGGSIQVESALGEGATFTVVLPLEVND
jgi:two-component system, sensor histidine kinase and response regulator